MYGYLQKKLRENLISQGFPRQSWYICQRKPNPRPKQCTVTLQGRLGEIGLSFRQRKPHPHLIYICIYIYLEKNKER